LPHQAALYSIPLRHYYEKNPTVGKEAMALNISKMKRATSSTHQSKEGMRSELTGPFWARCHIWHTSSYSTYESA